LKQIQAPSPFDPAVAKALPRGSGAGLTQRLVVPAQGDATPPWPDWPVQVGLYTARADGVFFLVTPSSVVPAAERQHTDQRWRSWWQRAEPSPPLAIPDALMAGQRTPALLRGVMLCGASTAPPASSPTSVSDRCVGFKSGIGLSDRGGQQLPKLLASGMWRKPGSFATLPPWLRSDSPSVDRHGDAAPVGRSACSLAEALVPRLPAPLLLVAVAIPVCALVGLDRSFEAGGAGHGACPDSVG